MIPLIIWTVVLGAAYTKYAIETTRGNSLDFKAALRVGERKALGLIGLQLVLMVIIMIGMLFFIIPGLVFLYWFLFAPYVYIDQQVGILQALKKSRQLVRGKLAEILGLIGANLVFALPAAIPFIGSVYQLIYTPVSQLAFAYRYVSAQALAATNKPKPATDPANYWAIVVLVLLPALFIVFMIVFGLSAAFLNSR